MYAKVVNDEVKEIKGNLGWLDENQQPVTDEVYAHHGWYKIVGTPPTVTWPDYVTQNPREQWTIDNTAKTVTRTYTTETLSAEQIKNTVVANLQQALQKKINDGVTWDNNVWSISEEARLNYAGLYARIQAGRGLPNNAADIKISSTDHQRHVLTPQQVSDLAERVSDYWASLMEVYADKMEEVALAVDPMAVDIETGWPS